MGSFVYLAVSKSVTQEEWEKVYEESLKLVDALDLSEFREMEIRGTKVACITKTKERMIHPLYGDPYMAWVADGDYEYMTSCEDNSLPRQIRYTPMPDAVDPLLAISRSVTTSWMKNPLRNNIADYWDGKTQMEPQHMSLLAIGCFFEDRLKNRAFVYGDISKWLCSIATRMANRILSTPIKEPDSCDLHRFYERIRNFPEEDQFNTWDRYYLGEKDTEFWNFLREHYAETLLKDYWKEKYPEIADDSFSNEKASLNEKMSPTESIGRQDDAHEVYRTYDIMTYSKLLDYQSGNTIEPGVQNDIVGFYEACRKFLHENDTLYQRLLKETPEEKRQVLADRSLHLLLRDLDWKIIFLDIEKDPDSFARYWSASNVQDEDSRKSEQLAQAYVLNDDLYQDLWDGKLTSI